MPTVVNAYSGGNVFSTSVAVDITAVTSGNTLLVGFFASQAPSGVTDDGGASPTYVQDRSSNYTGNNHLNWYRRSNITDGPDQVTITVGASAVIRYTILEVSGLDNDSPVGQQAVGSTGGFTLTPTVSATTATANELAFALFVAVNSREFVTPSGWTRGLMQADPTNATAFYDEDVGAAGSISCSPTLQTSGSDSGTNAYSQIVTYLAAGGGSSFQTAWARNSNQVIQ